MNARTTDLVLGMAATMAVWGSGGAALWFRHQFDGGWTALAVGASLCLAGVSLVIAGRAALGPAAHSPSPVPTRLITDGVYRRLRHPIYLGVALLLAGVALAMQSTIGLLATVCLAWPLQWYVSLREERHAETAFGTAYARYRQGTWF